MRNQTKRKRNVTKSNEMKRKLQSFIVGDLFISTRRYFCIVYYEYGYGYIAITIWQ